VYAVMLNLLVRNIGTAKKREVVLAYGNEVGPGEKADECKTLASRRSRVEYEFSP
jgi:hypothetical protein